MFRSVKSFRLFALSGLFALAVSGSALAGSANLIVGRNSRVCLPPIYAAQHVDASGTASPGVVFTVNRSPDNYNYVAIYQTADKTLGFNASFDRLYNPSQFPGYFKLCARNTSTTQSANVYLSISGY